MKLSRAMGLLSALALGLGAGSAWCAAASFDEAVAAALASNPKLSGAQAELASARERVRQAWAGLLPNVEAMLSKEHEVTRWDRSQESKTDPETAQLSLEQPLFDRRAMVALRQAKPFVAGYEWELEATRQGLALEVAEVYLGVMKAREVAELARKNAQVVEKHLQATRVRHEVGELTRTDVSQAQARSAAAQAERIRAENAIAVAGARFHEVVGEEPPANLASPAFTLPKNKEEGPRIEARPDLLSLKSQLQASEEGIALAQAGHWPVLSLSSSASRSRRAEVTGRDDPVDRYGVQVALRVPIYAGGETVSKTDQARADRDAVQARLDTLRAQAAREIRQGWMEVDGARSTAQALDSAVKAARDALNGVEQEFAVGARTALDVLDAENELFDAETELAKNHFDLLVTEARLLKAVGGLLPPVPAPK